MADPNVTRDALRRKAALGTGVSLICLLFLGETVVAHQTTPSPASPIVWTVLGATSAASALFALRAWLQLKRLR